MCDQLNVLNCGRASAPLNEVDSLKFRYDISDYFAKKLDVIAGKKYVLICDDSTSMRERLNNGLTKWDELKASLQIVLEITSAYNVECDVLFLNRPGQRNVRNIIQLQEQFAVPPTGNTPLTSCLNMAIQNNRVELSERDVVIIIFTDGYPTSLNLSKEEAIKELKNTLKNRNPIEKLPVTIVACTDDEYSLEYLNNWDNKIKFLDVVDDYESEKKQILTAGRTRTFTFADYIVKIMLGSFLEEIDKLDNERLPCCNII